ncbi:MAG: beta-mannosidase [Bacteroidales bacterium]|nr:beta-mannosidase [Bacteroidales bacterium]
MKNIVIIIAIMAIVAACRPERRHLLEPAERVMSDEAIDLRQQITDIAFRGYMIGHHDDPMYGIGWNLDENRSDIKSVCGDYPALMSFDLGHIELGRTHNLDSVPFDRIRSEIIAQYKRGGVSTLSWHVDNPVTGGNAWDTSDSSVVAAILPEGNANELFISWIDSVAKFVNSIVTDEGVKVPLIFRPWHEHTGSWFWWGEKLCTAEQYINLQRMTFNRLQEDSATQLLFGYSTGIEPRCVDDYLCRYPGDDMIDIIGFDAYQFSPDNEYYIQILENCLATVDSVGAQHSKPYAVCEMGYETIPDPEWWTHVVINALADYHPSYILLWRNAREKKNHYYAPYPGHPSADDFVCFYDDDRTLFVSDMTANENE